MSNNNKYNSENPAKKKRKEIIILDDDSIEDINNYQFKQNDEIINLSKNDIQTPSFNDIKSKNQKDKNLLGKTRIYLFDEKI